MLFSKRWELMGGTIWPFETKKENGFLAKRFLDHIKWLIGSNELRALGLFFGLAKNGHGG